MRPRTRIRLAAGLAAAAVLSLPSLASANVYCVDVVGGDCTHFPAGFQTALDDANLNGGADTVRLGANTYPAPLQSGFLYEGTFDPVSIVGSGRQLTTIATSAPAMVPGASTQYHGLRIQGQAGSSVSDLTVTLPTPPGSSSDQSYRGIFATAPNVDLERIAVSNPAVAIQAFGVVVPNGGTVSEATISMPSTNLGTTGVTNFGNSVNDLTVERSEVTASIPVTYSNEQSGQLELRGSTLRPESFGSGVEVQGGAARIESTLIDLGTATNAFGVSAANLNNNDDPIDVDADHVTIVGGGASTTGVRAIGNSTIAGENATLDLTNSVISGPAKTLFVGADNGETATMTTNYSNYSPPTGADVDSDLDDMGATGTATLTETNRSNLVPGFVDPAMGDYHLLPTSPLLDIGDPAAAIGTDIDGDPRGLSITGTCAGPAAGRRDIGADEFAPAIPAGCDPPVVTPPPVTPLAQTPTPAPPAKKCKKKRKKPRAVGAKKRKCRA